MELSELRQKMEKALAVLQEDLAMIKTGRATPALIEKIPIEAYGTKMPLMELAMISAPEADLLLVTPFDASIIKDIERGLSINRELGLSPAVDGNVIRLKIPPLSEERRKEFVKLLGQKIEAGRIMIRQIRGEKMRQIREASQRKEINEDEAFRAEQETQKITDEFNQEIEKIGKVKEVELLSV